MKFTHKGPILTTDIIIEYSQNEKEGIILVERKYFPLGLALPGGLAELGLTLEENAIKEAKEETNLEIRIENPEHPLCVHSSPKRDPRGHLVSTTFIAQGTGNLKGGDDAKKANLYSIEEIEKLLGNGSFAFKDHERAIKEYLEYRGYLKWKLMEELD